MPRALNALAAMVPWIAVPAAEIPAQPPAVEHHLHIQSAAVAALGNDGGAVPERGAAAALAALDAAGIERALVLSSAFRFGDPELDIDGEYARVRRENDFVAEQVATAPDRLLGACSVAPLADYAPAEIERCAADPRLGALKLHFTNSGVDLRDDDQVEALATLFAKLEALELPAVVHLRTGPDRYGEREAARFIDEILARAPTLPVQIAHMAGWGGYDEATDAALDAFVRAIREGRLDPERISFDLGAVVFQPEAAGDDRELEQRVRDANRQLAARIRELGLDRVVYATDWPGWPPVEDERRIAANVGLIRQALPLDDEEMARVFANVSVVVEAIDRQGRSVVSGPARKSPSASSGNPGPSNGARNNENKEDFPQRLGGDGPGPHSEDDEIDRSGGSRSDSTTTPDPVRSRTGLSSSADRPGSRPGTGLPPRNPRTALRVGAVDPDRWALPSLVSSDPRP